MTMVVERDSAGIAIVENRADTAALRSGWSIGPDPLLSVGGLDADESQQLFEVAGALRLPDGRIAVANGGTSDIRIFGTDGSLITTHGRRGEGPGEYMNPQLAGRNADGSLLVFDSQLRRVSVIDVDSGYVGSYLVGSEGGGFPLARGTVGAGNVLLGGGMYFSSDQGFPTGLVRPPSRYMVIGPDGEVVGDFGEIPAAEMFARTDGSSFSASGVPFGRVTAIAAGGPHVWLGTGDAWELRAYTANATLVRIVRFDWPLRTVSAGLIDAYIEERVADVRDENEARQIRTSIAEMPTPVSVPPYERFFGDDFGNLWVGEYLLPGETMRTWTIIGPDGAATGRLTMPPRTLPLDIGQDWILGLTRDELDVESLTLWSLQRPVT